MKRSRIKEIFEQILSKNESQVVENFGKKDQRWWSKDWKTLGFDEFDHVELFMHCEKEFNISIKDEEIDEIHSPQDVFNYLKERVGDKEELKYVPKVFFTSDLHLDHRNLVRKVSSWEDCSPCRDFETVEEMNKTIFRNINELVGEDDILWILGDFAISNPKRWKFLRDQINCKNVHLIYGNHDPISDLEDNKYFHLGYAFDDPKPDNEIGFNIGKLFSSMQHVKDLKVQIPGTNEHQRIFLSHYSHRTWESAHHGKWMLYGHSHGSLQEYEEREPELAFENIFGKHYYKPKKYKTMDVGIDTNNFYPYSMEQLVEIMKDRVNLGVDHHRPE